MPHRSQVNATRLVVIALLTRPRVVAVALLVRVGVVGSRSIVFAVRPHAQHPRVRVRAAVRRVARSCGVVVVVEESAPEAVHDATAAGIAEPAVTAPGSRSSTAQFALARRLVLVLVVVMVVLVLVGLVLVLVGGVVRVQPFHRLAVVSDDASAVRLEQKATIALIDDTSCLR